MLETVLIIVSTSILTCTVLALYVRRNLPNILADVGLSVQDQIIDGIKSLMKDPMVKRSMSILGKESGSVRAETALVERVSGNILESQPLLKIACEKLDITPVEALSLYNDPTVGPMIRGFLQGFDIKKLLSGGSASSTRDTTASGENVFGFG